MAQVFGAVALPRGLSAAAVAAIETQAALALQLEGAEDFSNLGRGGSLSNASKREHDKRDAEAALEFAAFVSEKLEREREEWARSKHEFAGVTMTGAEWGELGEELRRDGPLRQWLISRMIRDGKTGAQAAAKADEFADVYTALSKPPSQRTPEENAAIERAKRDPDFQRYTSQAAGQQLGGGGVSVSSLREDRTRSLDARTEAIAGAPHLSSEYRAALAASEPLDSPKPTGASTPAPLPLASAGLDI